MYEKEGRVIGELVGDLDQRIFPFRSGITLKNDLRFAYPTKAKAFSSTWKIKDVGFFRIELHSTIPDEESDTEAMRFPLVPVPVLHSEKMIFLPDSLFFCTSNPLEFGNPEIFSLNRREGKRSVFDKWVDIHGVIVPPITFNTSDTHAMQAWSGYLHQYTRDER